MQKYGAVRDSLEYIQQKASDPRLLMQMYKHDLDTIVSYKNRQKMLDREKEQSEKKAYNERLEQLKELEKMKEMSYKNYYQMLMAGQQHNTENFVSPFNKRDSVIDSHINVQLTEGQKKAKQEEMERNKRMAAMKDDYKHELMHQLEEKMQIKNSEKAERERYKQYFERYSRLPQEIDEYEKARRREEMAKYKEDLDRVVQEKYTMGKRRNSESFSSLPAQKHNPLSNPLPYNVQNPYILKQLYRNTSGQLRNASYLANIGNNNLV